MLYRHWPIILSGFYRSVHRCQINSKADPPAEATADACDEHSYISQFVSADFFPDMKIRTVQAVKC
jgi:hypothetical protein